MPTNRRGFTLIELMVAISIIAIIATVGLISYSKAQSVGRDAKRKQDLRSISVALELYRQTNGSYPAATSQSWANGRLISAKGATWITGMDNKYISNLPSEPKGADTDPLNAATNYGYVYWSGPTSPGTPTNGCPNSSTGGGYFILIARLENSSDKDTNKNQGYVKDCNGNALLTAYPATYDDLYVLTSQ